MADDSNTTPQFPPAEEYPPPGPIEIPKVPTIPGTDPRITEITREVLLAQLLRDILLPLEQLKNPSNQINEAHNFVLKEQSATVSNGATKAEISLNGRIDPVVARNVFFDATANEIRSFTNTLSLTKDINPLGNFGFNGRFFQFGDNNSENQYTNKPKSRIPYLEMTNINLSFFAWRRGFTVTGGYEPTGHNPNSLHYVGRAIDIRVWHMADVQDKKGHVTKGRVNIPNQALMDFKNEAISLGIRVRDERTRPPKQKVWGGPHFHMDVPKGKSALLNDLSSYGDNSNSNPLSEFKPWWQNKDSK
ncbi:hypothetical protein [Methylicorpusculum sp.]|uniref:hypothetical protein n=1 Tax=Methylicorpusculum sp. TaxID=2713644 RepID=UPI0027229D25|nr:hypothetical protein [Methylicorpusculum sp.]MDO8846540.1 hypothetical protein [Methylicorpusculum sp.]